MKKKVNKKNLKIRIEAQNKFIRYIETLDFKIKEALDEFNSEMANNPECKCQPDRRFKAFLGVVKQIPQNTEILDATQVEDIYNEKWTEFFEKCFRNCSIPVTNFNAFDTLKTNVLDNLKSEVNDVNSHLKSVKKTGCLPKIKKNKKEVNT